MKHRWSITAVLILAVAAAAFYFLGVKHRSVGKRTLDEWMSVYQQACSLHDKPAANHRMADEAIDAIRKMGEPAVRSLVDMLETKDSRLKLMLVELAQKQSVINLPFEPAANRRSVPVEILCDLGRSATNSVPRLIRLLQDPEVNYDAARVLASVGEPALKPLMNSSIAVHTQTRSIAVQALGWMGTNAAPAIPCLLGLLQETNRAVRSALVRTLGAIGTANAEVERKLGVLLVGPDALDAACGLMGLRSNCVPVFTRALTNTSRATQLAGIAGLQTWRVLRTRTATSHPREERYSRHGGATMFNLKSLSANMVMQRSGSSAFITRILIENLNEADPNVRVLSADMLSGFPGESALIRPALLKALEDDAEPVRAASRRTLEKLKPK